MPDPTAAALVALGEVRYVGVGTDENGRDTWNYRCLACGQKWHLTEVLPRTRGHRCSDRLDNHYGYCTLPPEHDGPCAQAGEQRG